MLFVVNGKGGETKYEYLAGPLAAEVIESFIRILPLIVTHEKDFHIMLIAGLFLFSVMLYLPALLLDVSW